VIQNKNYRQLPIFRHFPHLMHGFSTKAAGPLGNQEFLHRDSRLISFLSPFGISLDDCVAMNQVQGAHIEVVNKGDRRKIIPETDGLITRATNVVLLVKTSDCQPVSFYDPVRKIVGIAHLGWRGTLACLGSKMVQIMVKLGSRAEDIVVGVGPSIHVCCYDISKDPARAEKFRDVFPQGKNIVIEKDHGIFLDIQEALREQLCEVGVQNKKIEVSSICTYDHVDEFYSARAERQFIDRNENFMSFIGQKES
jgi:YfiH family protein